MKPPRVSGDGGTVSHMRAWIVAGLLVAALGLVASGCGGGGGGASADTTATTTEAETETTTTGTGGGLEETDGSFSSKSAICKEVNNQGSPLNIAASTGDFETAAARWAGLASTVPASLQGDVKTLAEGYRKIAGHPLGYGVLDTQPYKGAFARINAFTAKNCAQ